MPSCIPPPRNRFVVMWTLTFRRSNISACSERLGFMSIKHELTNFWLLIEGEVVEFWLSLPLDSCGIPYEVPKIWGQILGSPCFGKLPYRPLFKQPGYC